MERELILCIPGPWADRADFLRRLIANEPAGRFLLAGGMLTDLAQPDRAPLEFCERDARMGEAFQAAGQGKLPADCLERIREHRAVVYLHFPINLLEQRERVAKFTGVVRRAGGIALKLETAGLAHTWETWETRVRGSRFDLYCGAIVLVADKRSFYSCGMHHFGLPDCEVPGYMGAESGADLINRFNSWQINDRPRLRSGETFSVAANEPPFRLELRPDARHAPDDLFHNPHGVWCLSRATEAGPMRNQWKKPDDEPLYVAIANDNKQMLEAYAKARRTLPQFLGAIGAARFPGAIHSVKVKLRDDAISEKLGEDRFAYIWLWEVQEGAGTALRATVRELPKDGLSGLTAGETIHFDRQDVRDWMIVDGSQAWGGFTLRVVRERMRARERLQYDEYTGILCYNELE